MDNNLFGIKIDLSLHEIGIKEIVGDSLNDIIYIEMFDGLLIPIQIPGQLEILLGAINYDLKQEGVSERIIHEIIVFFEVHFDDIVSEIRRLRRLILD
jgi:hypothetical protein